MKGRAVSAAWFDHPRRNSTCSLVSRSLPFVISADVQQVGLPVSPSAPTWRSMMLPGLLDEWIVSSSFAEEYFRALRIGERGCAIHGERRAMNFSLLRLASASKPVEIWEISEFPTSGPRTAQEFVGIDRGSFSNRFQQQKHHHGKLRKRSKAPLALQGPSACRTPNSVRNMRPKLVPPRLRSDSVWSRSLSREASFARIPPESHICANVRSQTSLRRRWNFLLLSRRTRRRLL